MTFAGPRPASAAEARADAAFARPVGSPARTGGFAFELRCGERDLWLAISRAGDELAFLRCGTPRGPIVNLAVSENGETADFSSDLGAHRVRVHVFERGVVRVTASLIATRDVVLDDAARDLYITERASGKVHARQRGLRTGIVYATALAPLPFSLLYFQNFSALTDFFEATASTPADTVGGTWPELGFAARAGGGVVPHAREIVTSDAYLAFADGAPQTDGPIAARYLDLFAEVYLTLERPPVTYRDWPDRAARALRDLTHSPACTYERQGRRYLMPYVGDAQKPPESMVQLTSLVNTLEYDDWRGASSRYAGDLRAGITAFYRPDLATVARWLPGESFGQQAEENMNHRAMDSWYLHHALFNVSRLAKRGDASARAMFRDSLPYAMRVARRFNYRWPIFFDLETLDVIRAEAEPGKGGEFDVAGLYALVMIHAHEQFGDDEYLSEARHAAESLWGLGFTLGYQMNTTGMAAEAMMRLWKLTGERRYLELSDVCFANVLDNVWMWSCGYGRAKNYPTFFGLFPLHDAPYLAAYEELEAQGKFHEYLLLAGDDIRPALKLLLAEYQKYTLDRAWFYYPDAVPADVLASKQRNGWIERSLCVPVEDLQDGREASGQVGQELYGAGAAFVYASRHYVRACDDACLVYCNYPFYDVRRHTSARGETFDLRIGGDVRGSCELRVIPVDVDRPTPLTQMTTMAGNVQVELRSADTPEGHRAYALHGDMAVRISIERPS